MLNKESIVKFPEILNKKINNSVNEFGAQFTAFALFGLVNYPLFYIIWIVSYGVNGSREHFIPRLIATLLCFGLLMREHWPEKFRKYLPTYWYITLTYCLPFFFTFMLLHNPESKVWVMTFTSIIFWLVLLVDLSSAFCLLFIGMTAALMVFSINNDISFIADYAANLAPEYIGCLIVIAIFANNKKRLEKSKLDTAAAIGASLAHELRTPLSSIVMGVDGAKKYFPNLLDAYQTAKINKLKDVPIIPPKHFEVLATIFDDLQREANFSNIFIDMLLYNVNQDAMKKNRMDPHKISECVHQALQRYPFTDMQEKIIYWEERNDFTFLGSELLIIHVLFNLIKNALYQVEKAGKGEIYITQKTNSKFNVLCFKDTSTGMSDEIKHKLFQRFMTNKKNGTGLGLAFCRRVMQELGGDIECESVEGEFTEFFLYFPKTKNT